MKKCNCQYEKGHSFECPLYKETCPNCNTEWLAGYEEGKQKTLEEIKEKFYQIELTTVKSIEDILEFLKSK